MRNSDGVKGYHQIFDDLGANEHGRGTHATGEQAKGGNEGVGVSMYLSPPHSSHKFVMVSSIPTQFLR